MSKAQEKRNRQFRDSLTRRLTVLFNPFRNYNYKSYVDTKLRPHQLLLESMWGKYDQLDKIEEACKELEGKTYTELKLTPSIASYETRKMTKDEKIEHQIRMYNSPVSKYVISDKVRSVCRSRSVMNLLEIHRMQWLGEVKEMFDKRFNSMIDSMCNNIVVKSEYFKIEVEEVSNSWKEFEVLIHIEDTTFHARAIWVSCTEKISHYRFITTTRKK